MATLREILAEPPSVIVRDAAIKRFEYSFEAVWKAAQAYLSGEGFDVASPRGTVRTSLKAGLLSAEQAEQALIMIDDRNLTVHLYREAAAERIAEHIPLHAQLLSQWVDALRRRAERSY